MATDSREANNRPPLGGEEKAYVREQCWYPLISERKQRAGQRIKYLTLPGPRLTELRELVKTNVIEGPSDLILVESNLMDYYIILREAPLLPYHDRVEPITIINGDLDALINDGVLDRFLPVDAVNLDYCGFFWGGDKIETRKWNAVKRLIEVQARHELGGSPHAFTLLLTVQGRGDGSDSIASALGEFSEDIGTQWDEIKGLPYHGRLLYALPVMIIHLGIHQGYDVRCTHRYTYRPRSVEGKATMLSFGFTFEVFSPTNTATSSAREFADLDTQRCKDILKMRPIRLVFDRETQAITEEEYEVVGSGLQG